MLTTKAALKQINLLSFRHLTTVAFLSVFSLSWFISTQAMAAKATEPNIEISASIEFDGTAPFSDPNSADDANDGSHIAGEDERADNNVVRTFDAVGYRVDYNVNELDATDVVITATLPTNITWVEVPPGCLATSTITNDDRTLTCQLGDLSEGTSGAILPTATVGQRQDNDLLPMSFEINANEVISPTTSNALSTTISATAAWTWLKDEPDILENVDNAGTPGVVYIYPIIAQQTTGERGTAPVAIEQLPINFEDHAYGFPDTAVLATGLNLGGRTACGGYDGNGAFPYGTTSAAGSNANNTTAGAQAVVPEVFSCTLDTAKSTTNGYRVYDINITGHDTFSIPTLNADGSSNSDNTAIAGQIALWVSNADLTTAAMSNNDLENAITSSVTTLITRVPDPLLNPPAGIVKIPVNPDGPDGEVPEFFLFNNFIVAPNLFVPSSTGNRVIRTLARFDPAPFVEREYRVTPDSQTSEEPLDGIYRGYDYRRFQQGGLTDSGFPDSIPETVNNQTWNGTGIVARGQQVVVTFGTGSTSEFGLQLYSNLCGHIDNRFLSVTDFPTFDRVLVNQRLQSGVAIGSQSGISPSNGLAHAYVGYEEQAFGLNQRPAVLVNNPVNYVIEFAQAATPFDMSGPGSQSIAEDEVTCNNSDADADGWIDSINTAAVNAKFDPDGNGVYDNLNLVRLRVLEPQEHLEVDQTLLRGTMAFVHLTAMVKDTIATAPAGSKIYNHASFSYTEQLWDPTIDDGPTVEQSPERCVQSNRVDRLHLAGTNWCGLQYDEAVEGAGLDNNGIEVTFAGSGKVGYSNHDKITVVEAQPGIRKRNLAGLADFVDNGDTVVFEVEPFVSGAAIDTLQNVVVTDVLPTQLELISFTQPAAGNICSANGANTVITCNFGDRSGGFSDSFQVTARVRDAEAGQVLRNIARINATDRDQIEVRAFAYMVAAAPQFTIRKEVPDLEGNCTNEPGVPGGTGGLVAGDCSLINTDNNLVYELTYENTGNVPLNNFQIIDVLPHLADVNEAQDPSFEGTPASVGDLGDGRTPESNFNGTTQLVSVISSGSGTVEYTTNTAANVNRDPALDTSIYTNTITGATAFRYTQTDELDPGDTITLTVTISTANNQQDDIYTNTFGARADELTLQARSNDVSIMVFQPVSIGSYVWSDSNGDGLQGLPATEPPIAGAQVALYRENPTTGVFEQVLVDIDGNAFPSAINGVLTTSATGLYEFENLPEGNYQVLITPPAGAGYEPSPVQDANDNADSTTAGSNDFRDSNLNTSGTLPASLPAGFTPTNSFVSGEFQLTSGSEPTELGSEAGDDQDNSNTGAEQSGNMSVDFGFVRPVSIGSLVWQDVDGNGMQDVGEPLITQGLVRLLNPDGTAATGLNGVPIASINLAMGSNGVPGTYEFDDLPEGNYIVEVSGLPSGFFPTSPQTTSDDNGANELDSNIATEPFNGVYRSPVVNLTYGMEDVESDVDGIIGDGDNADNLADNAGDMTVDFGFVEPMSIGSLVWEDADGDGMQDMGESPITVGTVTLLDGMGMPVTTDLNGDPITAIDLSMGSNGVPGTYEFDNLPPGDYQVQVSGLAAGFGPSPVQTITNNDDTAGDSNIASEPTTGTYVSGTFTLINDTEPSGAAEASNITLNGDAADNGSANEDGNGNMTVDFGFVQTVSIGSVVWLDSDGDGLQDSTESLINAGTVTLLNPDGSLATGLNGAMIAPIDLSVTGGTYFFNNLPEGDYVVQVTPPAGYDPTPTQTGSDDNGANELDSNIDTTPTITVPAGSYVSPTISLAFGAEMTEDEMDGIASDGDDADNSADTAGDMSVDFGFVRPVSIGSVVWQDVNGNGTQDSGEPLITQGMVTLLDGMGNPVTQDIDGNSITAIDLSVGSNTTPGTYEFTNLPPGDYQVQVTGLASNLSPTPMQTTGNNNDTASDSNIATDSGTGTYTSGTFTLNSGTEPSGAAESSAITGAGDDADVASDADGNMTVDFGFVEPMSLGSVIWEDANANGIQDAGEPLITQGTVTLLDGMGNPVTTDINGAAIAPIDLSVGSNGVPGTYEFADLPPGDYQIQVTGLPNGYVASPVQNTTNDDNTATDSNIASEPSTGTYISTTLTLVNDDEPTGSAETSGIVAAGDDADDADDGNGNMTLDMGFTAPLSLGSLVWEDTNGDGTQDSNEPPIPGAQVSLLVDDGTGNFIPAVGINNNPVMSVPTGPDGLYLFGNLPNGDYQVVVTPPLGYFPSPVQGTSDDAVSTDSNIASEQTPNSGVYVSPIITLDSFSEPTESGAERGDTQDDSGVDTNGNMTVDFGFVTTATIGNYVWLDLDMDGVQDANEDGIAGVEVTLTPPAGVDAGNGPGVSVTTTTGANGGYLFPDLPPFVSSDPSEGYVVEINPSTLPPGLVQTYDEGVTPGSLGTLDHSSEAIQLDPREEHLTADFGYTPPIGSLGDTIWVDADDDGLQDPGEPGIAGVTVTVTPASDVDLGSGAGVPITTMTDENGKYLFTNLPLNETYIVTVDTGPSSPITMQGYSSSSSGLGDPDVRDGQSIEADDRTIVVLTTDNPVNLDADFGYLPADDQNNSIGDTIWIDEDRDGNGPTGAGDESDSNEAPIPGVTVNLIDNDTGNVIASDITDANGQYLFTGIPDGEYTVVITDQNNVLDGLTPTYDPEDGVTSTPATPNQSVVDVDSAGMVSTPVADLNQDFGYVDESDTAGLGTIGDTIFYDENDSTLPDAGEGLEGVSVLLYGPGPDGDITTTIDNVLLDQQFTDENGNYLFTGLDTSDNNGTGGTDYQVVVETDTLPNGGAGWINSVDPDTPSDRNNPGDNTSFTTLTDAVPNDLLQDFGYIGEGNNSLSGTVWPDTDGNGQLEESGRFAEVTIELRDQDGNIIATTETDADGNYEFLGLPDGIYTVVVTDELNVLSGFEHTDSPNGLSDTSDLTSKDDTGYVVDLDSSGTSSEPVTDVTGDFGYEPQVTNPISLGSFSSTPVNGSVQFDWVTQTEVSNLGFNLYAMVEGDWQPLNAQIILGQGDSVGIQTYQYTVQTQATVFALSDIDFTGKETLHGPYRLGQTYGQIGERQIIDWEAEKAERDAKEAQRQQQREAQQQERSKQLQRIDTQEVSDEGVSMGKPSANVRSTLSDQLTHAIALVLSLIVPEAYANDVSQEPSAVQELINLNTTESGIHAVGHAELIAAGLDLRGVDATQLSLTNRNVDVPIKVQGGDVFNDTSEVLFVADQIDTLYTDTNVYTLILGGNVERIEQRSTTMNSRSAYASSYLARKTFAPQSKYSFSSPDQSDPWYAKQLIAIGQPTTEQVTLTLDEVAPGGNSGSETPKMRVNVWGASNLAGAQKDHHLQVAFNGQTVASTRFDGVQTQTLESNLEQVKAGDNTITLTLPMDTGYNYDVISLNEIEINYPRKFVAVDNRLQFNSRFSKFRLRGFSSNNGNDLDVTVLAKVNNQIVEEGNVMARCNTIGCQVEFAGSSQATDYYVSANPHRAQVSALPLAQDINSGNASYLIISHPDFIGDAGNNLLESLSTDLQAEFGSVDVVDVQSIYAQYGAHLFDPTAIQRYIQYAYQNRGTRTVLLVGGDVYDYKQFENENATSFIPSLYASTGGGINFAPVDAKYADIDNDNVPDLSIARLPVRTTSQLATLLSKRNQYLNRTYAGKVLLVADGYDDVQQYDFDEDADEIHADYLSGFNVEKAYVDTLGVAVARQKVKTDINQGTTLTAFFGHSSTNQWSFNGLFNGNDAAGLQNVGKPTVVTQWGCWNAYYVSPNEDSMGHRFMMEGDKGAIAVMGASTLTDANNERRLARLVFAHLGKGERLGDAVTLAKQEYAQEYPDDLDVLLGWTILGLPELHVN